MSIDWFTIAAQVVNFLVLVWLLKRFFYRPILRAMDDREKHIADQLKLAETRTVLAEKEREAWQQKTREIDDQRTALLKQAMVQAESERRLMLEEARKNAEAMRIQWQESLRSEQAALQRELTTRIQHGVFEIARKTLADLAEDEVEARMANLFVKQLRELDGGSKQRLKAARKVAPDGAVIRSAFPLPVLVLAELRQVVREVIAAEVEVRFQVAPEVIGGIELELGGESVSWSISHYLESLEKDVETLTAGKEARNGGTI